MMTQTFRYTVIPVFATSVFAYCIFIIISFVGTGASSSYNFVVGAVCAIAAAFVNHRFALRERSVSSIAVLNAIMLVVTEFFCFSAPNDFSGFWLHLIAGICFAAPVIHGLMLSRNPIKLNTMLLYCEFSIAGTVILIALQLGNMTAPPFANGLSVAALILNLFMLSVLRISGPAKKARGGRNTVQRGALLSASLVGVVFVAIAIAVFLLPASRNALLAAVNATREAFAFVGKGLEDFVLFLFSLFPAGPQGGAIVASSTGMAASVEPDMGGVPGFDLGLVIRILIICAIVAAIVLITVIVRLRSKKVRARVTSVMVYEEEIGEGMSLLRALSQLAAMFRDWLLFRRYCSLRRDTYEGAFLRISRSAKRHGLHRNASETPRAFLCRIAALLAANQAPGCSADITAGLIDAISAAVDRRLYAAGPSGFATVTVAEAGDLSLFLKAIGKLRLRQRRKAPESA